MRPEDTTADATVRIPIGRGLSAVIDATDAEMVLQHKWHVVPAPRTTYARSTHGVFMHRLILSDANTPHIDHADGDGLNNRRANLRPCTVGQNLANAVMRRDNSSGYKGVEFNRVGLTKPWRAAVRCNGVRHRSGYFATAEEAAREYDKMARELFGAFARTNFP